MGKVTKLIVGCPVRERNWILDLWRDHVEQAVPGNWDLEYLFVAGEDDKETLDLLNEWSRTTVIQVSEERLPEIRDWSEHRLCHMVFLRNLLLAHVNQMKPSFFLSLDSDILIGQDTLRNMHETLTEYNFNVVGGLTWFDPMDKLCTNVGKWRDTKRSNFVRLDSHGTHPVDVVMGIKLMDPLAYSIPYEYDTRGEDIGWCRKLQDEGVKIGFDGRTPSKHIMSPEWIDRCDRRVGW